MCTDNQLYPGLHQKNHGQQAEEGDSPTLCHIPKTPAGVLHPALKPLSMRRMWTFGASPWRSKP